MSQQDRNFNKLLSFMAEKNLGPSRPEDILIEERIVRYCKEGGSDLSEWIVGYWLENDDLAATFGSWSSGEKFTFHSWSDKDKDLKYTVELKKIHQKVEEDREQQKRRGIAKAKRLWDQAKPCKTHPYLEKKGVIAHGLRVDTNRLVIPVYSIDGELTGLEYFFEDGEKKFMQGSSIKGNFAFIDGPDDEIYYCEGYATAASVFAATGKKTIICLSAGNILNVTMHFKEKYPRSHHILCQDVGEAGDKSAESFKKNVGGMVLKPDSTKNGYDFNDYHQEFGLEKLKEALKPNIIRPLSIDEFAEREKPPIEYIFKGLMTTRSLNLFYGIPGVGKSFVVYDLCFCAALGKRFGRWASEKKAKVLYIDYEMPDNLIDSRIEDLVSRYKDAPPRGGFDILSRDMFEEKNLYLDLWEPQGLAMLAGFIEPYDLIVLDNYGELTGDGPGEGHSNKEESFKPLKRLMRSQTCKGKTFILVHHENKSGSLYGTSAMTRPMDLIIQVAEPANKSQTHLHFDLNFNKSRYLESQEKRGMTFELLSEADLVELPENSSQLIRSGGYWKIDTKS